MEENSMQQDLLKGFDFSTELVRELEKAAKQDINDERDLFSLSFDPDTEETKDQFRVTNILATGKFLSGANDNFDLKAINTVFTNGRYDPEDNYSSFRIRLTYPKVHIAIFPQSISVVGARSEKDAILAFSVIGRVLFEKRFLSRNDKLFDFRTPLVVIQFKMNGRLNFEKITDSEETHEQFTVMPYDKMLNANQAYLLFNFEDKENFDPSFKVIISANQKSEKYSYVVVVPYNWKNVTEKISMEKAKIIKKALIPYLIR